MRADRNEQRKGGGDNNGKSKRFGSVTMEVGALLTLLNDISKYGLEAGTVIVNSIEEKATAGEFKTISISATQYANTMTAV
jgi:hypothetical protein